MTETFDCPHCGEPAKSRHGLERHAQAKHPGEQIWLCPDCTTVAKSESGMKRHQQALKHGPHKH